MRLDKLYTYEWPRPALTVDIVVFFKELEDTKVLLIKRKNEPFKGYWALPGGYVEEGETLIDAALRELDEETNINNVDLKQVGAWGDPGRDPRGWQVTVAFYGYASNLDATAGDDAGDARWFSINELPDLACDHNDIITATKERALQNEQA